MVSDMSVTWPSIGLRYTIDSPLHQRLLNSQEVYVLLIVLDSGCHVQCNGLDKITVPVKKSSSKLLFLKSFRINSIACNHTLIKKLSSLG